MKILAAGTGEGKTRRLIERSHIEWKYIICSTPQRVQHIDTMAKQLKIDIPYPISAKELPLRSPFIKEVLIDDLEDLLPYLIGKPVDLVTTSSEVINMKDYMEQFNISSIYNFSPPKVLKNKLSSDEYMEFIKEFLSHIKIENDNVILTGYSASLIKYFRQWISDIMRDTLYNNNPGNLSDVQFGNILIGYLEYNNIKYLIIPYIEKLGIEHPKIKVLKKYDI